jgi:aminopeptidase N
MVERNRFSGIRAMGRHLAAWLCAAAILGGLPSAAATAGPQESPAGSDGRDPAAVEEPRITAMDIDIALDPERGVLDETVTYTIAGRGVDSMVFSVHEGLSVERSKTNHGVVEHRKAGTRLEIVFDPPLDGERKITFALSGRPKVDNEPLIRSSWAVLGARDDWYPRIPNTWATFRVRIRAPEGWTAVAPGESSPHGSGPIREWRSTKPVRSLSVAAAPGLKSIQRKVVDTRVRVFSRLDSERLAAIASALSDPLAWFSGALVPYPFEGFNLVLIPGISRRVRASGMLVIPETIPIENPSDGSDLLSGQWFGEVIAGDAGWIDGFAAWQAATYARDRTSPLPSEVKRLRAAYFDLPPGNDVALSRAGLDAPEEVLRGKGSAAPDMIRLTMGDRAFFKAIVDLFDKPGGLPIGLSDVRAVFEKSSGRSMETAFSDWYERGGAPEIRAEFRTFPGARGGWRVDLTLRQRRAVYSLPVEVVFFGPGTSHSEVIIVNSETTSLVYDLPFEPRRVEVDPKGRIFRWGISP